MNLRYPPFFSVYDFSQFNKWDDLDEADKIRITTRIIKRIQRTEILAKKQAEFFTFTY